MRMRRPDIVSLREIGAPAREKASGELFSRDNSRDSEMAAFYIFRQPAPG
jgi:hypothetical protein